MGPLLRLLFSAAYVFVLLAKKVRPMGKRFVDLEGYLTVASRSTARFK